MKIGLVPSEINECVLYKDGMIYVLYTKDYILTGPNHKQPLRTIEKIKGTGLNLTNEGNIQDFLGININQLKNGTINMCQPHLIQFVLDDLNLNKDNAKVNTTPMEKLRILQGNPKSERFDQSFNHRSIIGKLGYLGKGSRPDILYAKHQCAIFAADPSKEHGEAIIWMGKYLHTTKDKGMIYTPKKSQGLRVYVDAEFSGNWTCDESDDVDKARS